MNFLKVLPINKNCALTFTNERPSLSCRNTTSFSASKDDKNEEEEEKESNVEAGAAAVLLEESACAKEACACKDGEPNPEFTRFLSFERRESRAPRLAFPAVVSAPATGGDKLMDEKLPVRNKK